MPDDGENSLDQKVQAWVEHAGFALELRVARALKAVPESLLVEPAKPYWDAPAEKWREADVVAYFAALNRPEVRLQVIAECKSGRNWPWVIFSDQHRYLSDEESLDRQLYSWGNSRDELEAAWRAGRGTAVLPSASPGYGIAEALSGESDQGSPRVPFRAIQQVVAAAHGLSVQVPGAKGNHVQVTLPIVVTGAPLYSCSLADDGTARVQRVEHMALTTQPDAGGAAYPLVVQVMSERHLVEEWAPGISSTLNFMVAR